MTYHIILASNYKLGDHYQRLMGIPLQRCAIISCDRPESVARLQGICGEIVLHRTQSWYKAGWTIHKARIRDELQIRLVGRTNVTLTVLNETSVVNTTFLS